MYKSIKIEREKKVKIVKSREHCEFILTASYLQLLSEYCNDNKTVLQALEPK